MVAKSILVVTSLELIQAAANSFRNLEENPLDHYCGTSWPNAAAVCSLPCPNGNDKECSSLGSNFECFGYTGCNYKFTSEGGNATGEFAVVEEASGGSNDDVVAANKFCGATR